MDPAASTDRPLDRQDALRRLMARDGRAVLLVLLLTVAAELGVYFSVRPATGEMLALLAALAATAVWIAIVSPAMAASAGSGLSALLRGGIVADASAVALLVLWAVCPFLSFVAAVKIYCIHAAMALFAVGAVRSARKPAGRHAAAAVTAAALMLALATPFWAGGAVHAAGQSTRRVLVSAAVYVNPFYATTDALFAETGFVWDEASFLYEHVQQLVDYAPPSPRWYAPILLLGGLAVVFSAVVLLRKRGPGDSHRVQHDAHTTAIDAASRRAPGRPPRGD